MITDKEVSDDLKERFRKMFSGEKHFIVDYPLKGKVYRYIVPLTEGDEYGVMSRSHASVPPAMEVLCMDMDIYLNNYLTADKPDMPERKEYEEAMKEGMYIFPQEVKGWIYQLK